SAAYQEEIPAARAYADVLAIERLRAGSELEMALEPSSTGRAERLRFTTYKRTEPIPLHVALPVLENMGFAVISERIYRVTTPDAVVYMQDFELETQALQAIDTEATGPRFMACF